MYQARQRITPEHSVDTQVTQELEYYCDMGGDKEWLNKDTNALPVWINAP